MIQDIFPYKLNNHYDSEMKISKDDRVICIDQNRILIHALKMVLMTMEMETISLPITQLKEKLKRDHSLVVLPSTFNQWMRSYNQSVVHSLRRLLITLATLPLVLKLWMLHSHNLLQMAISSMRSRVNCPMVR